MGLDGRDRAEPNRKEIEGTDRRNGNGRDGWEEKGGEGTG